MMRCVLSSLIMILILGMSDIAHAKDSLGIFDSWGAFRDPDVPRCYAIGEPEKIVGEASRKAFAAVGYWPKKSVRAQFYVRLSRDRSSNSRVIISISGRRFRLSADRFNGWAQDKRMDAALVAAVRSASSMSVESIGRDGKPIVDSYVLRGAATAIDAASLGCSRLR